MKYQKSLSACACLFSLATSSPAQEPQSDPEELFETAWKLYDLNYGVFVPKNVDWTLLYGVYRPKVTAQTTEDELFEIIGAMLKQLNDNHVSIRSDKNSLVIMTKNIQPFQLRSMQ